MLAVARRTTGADLSLQSDLGARHRHRPPDVPLVARPRRSSFGAITIGQALHFMDYTKLFQEAKPLLRFGGGIAVVANGVPLWQQDSDWSRALRAALGSWFHIEATATCGTDRATQQRYAEALAAAGYEISEVVHEYEEDLGFEQVLGGVYSALSPGDLPGDRRDAFAEHVRGSSRRNGHLHRRGPREGAHRRRPVAAGARQHTTAVSGLTIDVPAPDSA